VLSEESYALEALGIGLTRAVTATGYDAEGHLVMFVGSEKVAVKLNRTSGVHIAIDLSDREQEMAAKVGGSRAATIGRVPRPDWPSEPLLVPPEFVDAVVVASAVGHAGLVEVAVV
jgi:hypothetical protein